MTKLSFSSKLKAETRKYPSSIAIISLVGFITISIFLVGLVIKGIFFNSKKETNELKNEAPITELEETKIEPQNPKETKYIVKSGDTLYSIGIKFKIDWKKIAEANNLKEPYTLSVGQELIIPEENK